MYHWELDPDPPNSRQAFWNWAISTCSLDTTFKTLEANSMGESDFCFDFEKLQSSDGFLVCQLYLWEFWLLCLETLLGGWRGMTEKPVKSHPLHYRHSCCLQWVGWHPNADQVSQPSTDITRLLWSPAPKPRPWHPDAGSWQLGNDWTKAIMGMITRQNFSHVLCRDVVAHDCNLSRGKEYHSLSPALSKWQVPGKLALPTKTIFQKKFKYEKISQCGGIRLVPALGGQRQAAGGSLWVQGQPCLHSKFQVSWGL